MTNRKIQYWVIPPDADAEFVAAMEEILDTSEKPHDADYQVVCMDEQPVQLHKEIRQPIPATRKTPGRVDYEYERCGTASTFLFTEPLAGWRQVTARPQRTKADWAVEMERLLATRYARAEKIILICDNLNTHTRGAFYEAFPAEKARSVVRRIEFCYAPKHGSWLNAAENELSSLRTQCLATRRFPTIASLRSETQAWTERSNQKQKGVDWQFQIGDARVKLVSLYPKIKTRRGTSLFHEGNCSGKQAERSGLLAGYKSRQQSKDDEVSISPCSLAKKRRRAVRRADEGPENPTHLDSHKAVDHQPGQNHPSMPVIGLDQGAVQSPQQHLDRKAGQPKYGCIEGERLIIANA
jgi:DDE superfamily endonuclease